MRRRAIAQSIIWSTRLWNSDSESFSELSSDEAKSSDSWVTEEEEVIVGVGGSELQQVAEIEDEGDHCRDLPTSVVINGQSHSESGVESAESWFTSSDASQSQPPQDKHAGALKYSELCSKETQLSHCTPGESQPGKTERVSVCSSVSTDDSLAWETACEELPVRS